MEKLLRKLKSNTTVTFILWILSIVWIIIDYFVINKIITENNIEFGFDVVLLIASGVIFLLLHFWVFLGFWLVMRVQYKYKSELKKKAKEEEIKEAEFKMLPEENIKTEE